MMAGFLAGSRFPRVTEGIEKCRHLEAEAGVAEFQSIR